MGSRAPKPGCFPCISLGRCCGFLLAGFPAAGVSGYVVMCSSLGTPPCSRSPVAVPVTPSAGALHELGGGRYPHLTASQPLPPASREPGTVQGLAPGVFCSAASSAPPALSPSPCSLGEAAGVGHCEASPPAPCLAPASQARHRAERQNAGLYFCSELSGSDFSASFVQRRCSFAASPSLGAPPCQEGFSTCPSFLQAAGKVWCVLGEQPCWRHLPPLHDLHGLWSHAFNGLSGILFK